MAEVQRCMTFENDRLVCCVCDKTESCLTVDYLCSKNCQKLFVLTQGLILGTFLQSLFGGSWKFGVCEVGNFTSYQQTADNIFKNHKQTSQNLEQKKPNEDPEDNNIDLNKKKDPLNLFQNSQDFVYVEPTYKLSDSYQGSASSVSDVCETVISKCVISKAVKPKTHLRIRPKQSDVSNSAVAKSNLKGRPKQPDVFEKRNNRLTRKQASVKQTCNSKTANKQSSFNVGDLDSQSHDAMPTSASDEDSLLSFGMPDAQMSKEKKQTYSVEGKQNKEIITEKRRTKCKQCGKMISKSYLYVHYRAMHKDSLSDISHPSVACSDCGKMFMRKQALNAHKLKRHNHTFTNTCSHCGKSFASVFGLSWHMRQIHKVTVRQCGDCGDTFANRRDYKKHRLYKHAANSHVCHICGKGFKLNNALQAHLDAHAGVKLHFCEICGDGFVRFSCLCQHRNNLHGPKKSELPFKCQLCPNTFKLQSWLDKHVSQKHNDGPGGVELNGDCNTCLSSVISASVCPIHGGVAKNTFSCPQCDKVFSKDTNLKVHMKQHQEPKFSCDVCHRKFTYKCNMLRHRDTHNADKSFHCDICSKQFCTKFLLASHMRMHNQDLMFKCEICGKGLTRKDYLKNHIKKMHPDTDSAQPLEAPNSSYMML